MSNQEETTASTNPPIAPSVTTTAAVSHPPSRIAALAAWLALLLVVALAAAAGWFLPRLQQGDAALDTRLDQFESRLGRDQQQFDRMQADLQDEIRSRAESLQSATAAQLTELTQSIESAQAQLSQQGDELAQFRAADRSSWLLAEAEYLLRLANQRLIMAGDTTAAGALLGSADRVLQEINDPALHPARAAIAADLAAVRAVPALDTEGVYLRLSALIDQCDRLAIFNLPEHTASPAQAPADTWRARLQQGFRAALDKLSSHLVIRRRDTPVQALMDPQYEGLMRLNLRLLLGQAQMALLSGNQSLYRASLERADQWVDSLGDADSNVTAAITAELEQLSALNVAAEHPDISGSLQALDEAIRQRQQREQTE